MLSILVTVSAVPTLLKVSNSNAANVAGSPGGVGELLEPTLGIVDQLGTVLEGWGTLKECPRTIPCAVHALMRVSEPCTHVAFNVLWAVCKLAPEECVPTPVEAGLAAKLMLVI
ncbi:U-box domain-containing protein 30 [Ananas comosus]|uniref:U-box domain-containing protein 30 n=1 Tax=Ananas comosus TaxID=4615 RepID=A0A199VEL2_ANACO|nr:U-box domain-containing protein 30 [Ananas comosus]